MSPIVLLLGLLALSTKGSSAEHAESPGPGNPTAQLLDDDNLLVRFDDGSLAVIGVNYGFGANVNNATTIALRYGDKNAALAKWKQLRPQLAKLPPGNLRIQVLTEERVTAVYSKAGTILIISKPSIFRVAPDHETIAMVFAGTPQKAAETWAAVRSQFA